MPTSRGFRKYRTPCSKQRGGAGLKLRLTPRQVLAQKMGNLCRWNKISELSMQLSSLIRMSGITSSRSRLDKDIRTTVGTRTTVAQIQWLCSIRRPRPWPEAFGGLAHRLTSYRETSAAQSHDYSIPSTRLVETSRSRSLWLHCLPAMYIPSNSTSVCTQSTNTQTTGGEWPST